MAPKPQIRVARTIQWRLRWMLAIVKDINFCTNSLSGNNKWVLRHIASTIHFPIMINLLNDLHLHEITHRVPQSTRGILEISHV